jgi:hypothetical protein
MHIARLTISSPTFNKIGTYGLTSVKFSFIGGERQLHQEPKVGRVGLMETLHTLGFVKASLVKHEWKDWNSSSTFQGSRYLVVDGNG